MKTFEAFYIRRQPSLKSGWKMLVCACPNHYSWFFPPAKTNISLHSLERQKDSISCRLFDKRQDKARRGTKWMGAAHIHLNNLRQNSDLGFWIGMGATFVFLHWWSEGVRRMYFLNKDVLSAFFLNQYVCPQSMDSLRSNSAQFSNVFSFVIIYHPLPFLYIIRWSTSILWNTFTFRFFDDTLST